jgi:hypothetical protein
MGSFFDLSLKKAYIYSFRLLNVPCTFTQVINRGYPSCPCALCSPKHEHTKKIRNYRQWGHCLSQLRDAWSEKFCVTKRELIILNFPNPAFPSVQTYSELHCMYVSCVSIYNNVTTDYYAREVWFSLETVEINNPLCPESRTENFEKQILVWEAYCVDRQWFWPQFLK